MRSEDLDPSGAASGVSRSGRERGRIVAAVAATVAIAAGGAVGLLATATAASASTVTETFAGHGPTGPLELQLSETINQPANVAPGGKVTISVAGSSQTVPTSQSGVPVNYIAGLKTLVPVPGNSTFVSGSIVAGNWSYTPAGGGSPTTGPLTVTECTAAGTGCTASSPSATFLGPGTTTPYLEASTGTAQFPAGGKLTMPSWSFDVTAGTTGSIQSTVSEFDTMADISLAGTAIPISLATYPAVTVSSCLATPAVCATQPAYKFQPIATTTIGSSAGATTTTTAASGGSTTTTTVAASSGGATTTTSAAVAAGSSAGSSSSTTTASGNSLAYTGPPKMLWVLGIVGLVLLDLGYLSVSATWKRRRSGNSSAGCTER